MNAVASHAPTVLVVEDDPHLAAGVVENLRLEGFTVHHVGDGRAALESGFGVSAASWWCWT